MALFQKNKKEGEVEENKKENETVDKKEESKKNVKEKKVKVSSTEVGSFDEIELKKDFIDILLSYGIISEKELLEILEIVGKKITLTNFLKAVEVIDEKNDTNIYVNIVKQFFGDKLGYEVILDQNKAISIHIKDAFNQHGLSPKLISKVYDLGVIPIDLNLASKHMVVLTTTPEIMSGFRNTMKELLGSSLGNKTLTKVKVVLTTPSYYKYYKSQLELKDLTTEI